MAVFMLKKSGEAPAVQALSGPLLLKSINIALGHETVTTSAV